MKPKRHANRDDEMRPEYDFSNAVRGKYYERYRRGVTIHVTEIETTSATLLFSDAGAVDAAQLGELLFLFRGAYAAGLGAFRLAGGDPRQLQVQASSIHLPSVSEASEALREALVPRVKAPLGYGIRSRRLKLSKDELNELLRHDPATEKRGGFQRFLIGLQSRVNRVSGEIELSDSEMNTILRHGRNPSRGGWQASIRRIFDRHFGFDAT